MNDTNKIDKVLEKSVIKPGFETLKTVPTEKNEKKLKMERKVLNIIIILV